MGVVIVGLTILILVVVIAVAAFPATSEDRQARSDALAKGDYQTAHYARKEEDRKVGVVIGIVCCLAVVGAMLFFVTQM